MPVRTARGLEYRWVNTKRARNEVLDCTVYAIFCTHQLELHTYPDRSWARLEQALQPDLFAPPAVAHGVDEVEVVARPAPDSPATKPKPNPLLQRPGRSGSNQPRTW